MHVYHLTSESKKKQWNWMWFVIGFSMVHQMCTVPHTPHTNYMIIKRWAVCIPILIGSTPVPSSLLRTCLFPGVPPLIHIPCHLNPWFQNTTLWHMSITRENHHFLWVSIWIKGPCILVYLSCFNKHFTPPRHMDLGLIVLHVNKAPARLFEENLLEFCLFLGVTMDNPNPQMN